MELLSDKYTSENNDKYYLGKIFFHDGKGKKGGHKISSLKIIDFDSCEGKSLSNIKTIWGEDFIKFHHNMLSDAISDYEKKIYDASAWAKEIKKDPGMFYIKYLSLFISKGVLFENFIMKEGDSELFFTEKVVLPSFKKLLEIFGVKPLIVALNPFNMEDDVYWRSYHGFMKTKIKNYINKKNGV